MTRIKLFLMRHSKSCSNYLRNLEISSHIRDPGLTEYGRKAALSYGPELRNRLQAVGFNVRDALICSSTLRRAQDTARFVFGREPRVLPGFAENGSIPENTPLEKVYERPNMNVFMKNLHSLVATGDSVSVVGHGSYLRSLWPLLTGAPKEHPLKNMEGILCDVELSTTGLRVLSFKEFPYTGPSMNVPDTCEIEDTEKIARLSNMGKNQSGGGVNMPLAYFKDGAQMQGTFAEPTGVQGGAWFRPALTQSGGKRRTQRRERRQRGGFSPSVMGSFAVNGLRLVPVAAYMGYKMYSGQKTRKATRRKRKN
jgi:broad specificity phosphatase PhoE